MGLTPCHGSEQDPHNACVPEMIKQFRINPEGRMVWDVVVYCPRCNRNIGGSHIDSAWMGRKTPQQAEAAASHAWETLMRSPPGVANNKTTP